MRNKIIRIGPLSLRNCGTKECEWTKVHMKLQSIKFNDFIQTLEKM